MPDIKCLQIRADTLWTEVALIPASGPSPAPTGGRLLAGHFSTSAVPRPCSGSREQRPASLCEAVTTISLPKRWRPLSRSPVMPAGPFETPAREILALSKLDWNNDALHGLTPVAVADSQRLAKMIGRVPSLPDDSYQSKLFM